LEPPPLQVVSTTFTVNAPDALAPATSVTVQ
jgi:hypothetical protein